MKAPYFDFSGGLNTESSPLHYPENAMQDMDNVVLQRDGSIRCRLGIGYEFGYAVNGPILDSVGGLPIDAARARRSATGIGKWESVGGDGSLEFTVVQIGNLLYFHDATVTAVSAGLKPFIINLDDYKVPSISYEDKVSFASGNGYLFVVGKQINPIYVKYDSSTDTISVAEIEVFIRDFRGVEDGLDINERPTTLSNEHEYNLRNQGWPTSFMCSVDDLGEETREDRRIDDPLAVTYSKMGVYPSNADIIQAALTVDVSGIEVYWPYALDVVNVGSALTAKGRFIVNAFDINRSAASGITGIPREIESSRPSTVAFYAGRVWYSGLAQGNRAGNIYFSQLIEEDANIGNCYQAADPTSSQISDIVDTDGGLLNIADAGQIYRILSTGRSLLVFCSNGTWEITGIDGSFIATGYSVNKISEQGVFSPEGIVQADAQVYFIGKDGIFRLVKEDFGTNFKGEDLSNITIQTFLNDISPFGKEFGLGVYDSEERRVTWFFNNTDDIEGINYRFIYDKALVYDITLGAFFPLTLSRDINYPVIAGVGASRKYSYIQDPTTVVVGADDVTDGTQQVILDTTGTIKDIIKYKYLTIYRDKRSGFYYYTFSELNNLNFKDWENFDNSGITYGAFLETGPKLVTSPDHNKQISYVNVYMKYTDTGWEYNSKGQLVRKDASSCKMQVKFDWTKTAAAKKWSKEREVYRPKRNYYPADVDSELDDGYSVMYSRHKVLGRGRAVQFRFSNTQGKNFHLYGWSVDWSATQ